MRVGSTFLTPGRAGAGASVPLLGPRGDEAAAGQCPSLATCSAPGRLAVAPPRSWWPIVTSKHSYLGSHPQTPTHAHKCAPANPDTPLTRTRSRARTRARTHTRDTRATPHSTSAKAGSDFNSFFTLPQSGPAWQAQVAGGRLRNTSFFQTNAWKERACRERVFRGDTEVRQAAASRAAAPGITEKPQSVGGPW